MCAWFMNIVFPKNVSAPESISVNRSCVDLLNVFSSNSTHTKSIVMMEIALVMKHIIRNLSKKTKIRL